MNAASTRCTWSTPTAPSAASAAIRHEVVVEGTDEPEITDHDRVAGVRVQGQAGRPAPAAAPVRALPPAAGLADVVRRAVPALRAGLVRPVRERLLENDPPTLRLLRHNPFPDAPPRYVRARLYRYRFTTWRELRRERAWWHRTLVGEYLPPVALGESPRATAK